MCGLHGQIIYTYFSRQTCRRSRGLCSPMWQSKSHQPAPILLETVWIPRCWLTLYLHPAVNGGSSSELWLSIFPLRYREPLGARNWVSQPQENHVPEFLISKHLKCRHPPHYPWQCCLTSPIFPLSRDSSQAGTLIKKLVGEHWLEKARAGTWDNLGTLSTIPRLVLKSRLTRQLMTMWDWHDDVTGENDDLN